MRGSGKRLVSLFLGCALIVVGLIGPQVVGRADVDAKYKIEEGSTGFGAAEVEQGATSVQFTGTVVALDNIPIASISALDATATLSGPESGSISVTGLSKSSNLTDNTLSFTLNVPDDAKVGDYTLAQIGCTLTTSAVDAFATKSAITVGDSFKLKVKAKETPKLSGSFSINPVKQGETTSFSAIVSSDVQTIGAIKLTLDEGSDYINIPEHPYGSHPILTINDNAKTGTYKLAGGSSVEVYRGGSKTNIETSSDITLQVEKSDTPTTPTLTVDKDKSSSTITRSDSTVTGAFAGTINNISGTINTKAVFKNGSNVITSDAFSVTNNSPFTAKFSVPTGQATGNYNLTTMPGIAGLVIAGNEYHFNVRTVNDPLLVSLSGISTNPYSGGDRINLSATFNNVSGSAIGGTLVFRNRDNLADVVTAGFSTNTISGGKATVNATTSAIPENNTGNVKTYTLDSITHVTGISGDISIDKDAKKSFTVKANTSANPTLTKVNLTSEVLPNGIVYFSGMVSPKPAGDTITAKFVPGGVEANAINFSTGISSDGSFNGQITLNGVAVGSEYELTNVQVGTTNITWDGQYMFRVVSSVSTPTLSTLAIGTPYTTSGTTTIPLSATIASAGTTGGVANTIKYIEIDYAIDTTTPTKATLYPVSGSPTLFRGDVARQFTNGSSHTISLSRARVYYQAGSDTSGNKVKEYDSLTGLITNNPLRFTVSNYTPSPVNPVNPVDPSNPSTPTNNTAVNQRAANTIIAMANNGSATLDYTASPTVSANIFDLLRGTQKTVNLLAPGGFIWTFNGATVTGASKQIDLRVTATTLAATGATNSFPLVASLTGNRPVVILNFANNGVLPGTATITIPVSQHTSYIGTSNIYQYFVNESTRRLEKVGGPVTVSSGNTVTMAINHNSTYILTYGEVAGATASTTPTNNASDVLPIYNANATPTVTTPTNTTPTAGTTVNTVYRPGSTSPKTGDAFRMYVWVGMLLIGAFLVFASVLWPKKKEKSA